MYVESSPSSLRWVLVFQPNFTYFWIFLDLLVSVNDKSFENFFIFKRNVAGVWHINIMINILLCVGIGIWKATKVQSKQIVVHSLCTDQIYVIIYSILPKPSWTEYEWVTLHKYGFWQCFQAKKMSLSWWINVFSQTCWHAKNLSPGQNHG